jgi:hypothetical protein
LEEVDGNQLKMGSLANYDNLGFELDEFSA